MAKSGKDETRKPADNSGTDDDVAALFTLPFTEFTGARNELAARLKRSGRGSEAERVKTLAKPPISAWTVNQLYWKHRATFDRLIAASDRFRQAKASQLAGRATNMTGLLEARRDALSELSRLAAELLQASGHNPTSDILRRIATTLEALSVHASVPGAVSPGRLTSDLDPPGFESLAALMPADRPASRTEAPAALRPLRKAAGAALKESRQARITAVKGSLEEARRVLGEARARAQRAETELKKAQTDADRAEKHKREAEERLKTGAAAAEEARRRMLSLAAEMEDAAKAAAEAESTVATTSAELQLLLKPSDET